MPTPSELVTDAFATAQGYASQAESKLTTFTNALNAAVQNAPVTSITFAPVMDPGVSTLAPYEAPADYTSSLITQTAADISTRMAGGTGLDATVEAELWDRARERRAAAMQASIDTASYDAEAMGFMLPPGVLFDGIRREQRAYYDDVAAAARDISIEQAKLEQTNLQKVFDQAISFEQMLADVRFKRSQVSVDAYRMGLEKFRAEVDQDMKHWETQIRQYEAQITYTLHAEKLNSEVIRANASAVLDAAKVGAQVYAQLTASAYSLIHASASVTAGSQTGVSYTYSNKTSSSPASVTAI